LKDNGKLFTGLIWTGAESIKLGLADAIGSADYVAKEVIGAEDLVDFTPRERLLDRIAGRVGASFGQQLSSLFHGTSIQLR
jgi:protease-4